MPELPIQYGDFAVWQRRWLSGEVLASQLAYWKDQLSGAPPVLDLPTDRPRPAVRRGRGARESFVLPAEPLESLRALVREQGATLFMGLLTGFVVLLERYTGQEDLTVGTPIAGRTRVEVEGLIGFFVNTLVLRADLSGDPSFVDQLKRMREVSLGAYAHQELPFERVVEELEPVRDLSRTPLFQAMFVLQNVPLEALDIEGLRLDGLELDSATAKFDLTLSMVEREGGLRGSIEYDTDLFDRSTVCRLAEHLRTLLSGALAAPYTALSDLPLQTAAERHQLLTEYNDTEVRLEGETCVHRWIERQASLSPEAVAVVCEGSVLSYGELDSRANRLGRHLRRLGVGPEVVVGICAERSVELLVGLLGILKAGGAYLPLDPSYPLERLAFMVEDGLTCAGRPALLVVQGRFSALFAKWSAQAGARQIDLDKLGELEESGRVLDTGAWPDNAAYIIYTSGSTGRPKGVMVPHRALASYLAWGMDFYRSPDGQGSPVHTSLSFDLSVTSLFLPLLWGQKVVLIAESEGVDGLGKALTGQYGFSFVKLTPSHARLLGQQLPAGGRKGQTRAFILGGEALQAEDLALWRDGAPETVIHNEYGPTETVVGCCIYSVPAAALGSGFLPIGRPIVRTRVYLLDPASRAGAGRSPGGALCRRLRCHARLPG